MSRYPVPYRKFQRLRQQLRRRPRWRPPDLTVAQILHWADQWHDRTGRWPIVTSGTIPGTHGDTWTRVHTALYQGCRGLPGGSTLARLLNEYRSVRNPSCLPRLTEKLIVQWADRWRRRTGRWPTRGSGPIAGSGGESWRVVDQALKLGLRGLPGNTSLAKLLHRERRVRHNRLLPRFNIAAILRWADAFHERTNKWPSQYSGTIPESPGDTWIKVQVALRVGTRGLPGGSSLSELLYEKRGVRRGPRVPNLTVKQVLAWADDHFRRTGAWPRVDSGPVLGAKHEKWGSIDAALGMGLRGLPGGSSIAKVLSQHRGVRVLSCLPPLTEAQILKWADSYHRKTGKWPTITSGEIPNANGETWNCVQRALMKGIRGLPGGSSLAQLLDARRGKPNHLKLPPLSEREILCWVDGYHAKHGTWPLPRSGPIPQAPPDVSWETVDRCLRDGSRGLSGGSSLALLLERERGRVHLFRKPRLTVELIKRWAKEHRAQTGRWPLQTDGEVSGAPGEKWHNIDMALRNGSRGLRGGSSLARVLDKRRDR